MRTAHTLAAAFLLASTTPAGAGGLSLYYGSSGHYDGHVGHRHGDPGAHLGYGHFFYPPVFVAPPHLYHHHRFFPRFRDHDRHFLAPGHGHHRRIFPRFHRHDWYYSPPGPGYFPPFEPRHSFGPLDRHPSTVTPPPFQGRGFGGP